MRGFTLIEVVAVILITVILAGIALKFTVFSGDTLYLKNFVYKFGSNINLLKDFSLARKIVNINGIENKACSYGINIKKGNQYIEYFGYVFATSSLIECSLLASTTPLSFVPSSGLYLHTNGEIRQSPIEPLQIKDKFENIGNSYFKISITSNDLNCTNDLFNNYNYNEIALVYYNPYGDILLLGKSNNNWTSLLNNSQDIYFCLRYKNETRNLKINQTGQIVIENF